MPVIREYVTRVGAPGAADLNLPTPTPGQFGGRTAAALQRFGAAATGLGAQLHDLQVERETSGYLAAEGQLSIELTRRQTDALADGSAARPDFVDIESEFAAGRLDEIAGKMNTREGSLFAQRRGVAMITSHSESLIKNSSAAMAKQQRTALESYVKDTALTITNNPIAYDEEIAKLNDALFDSPAYNRFSLEEKELFMTETRAMLLQTAIKSMLINLGAKPARDFLAAHKSEMVIEQYDAVFDWLNAETSKEDALAKEQLQNSLLKKIRDMVHSGGNPGVILDAAVADGTFTAEAADSLREWGFNERQKLLNIVNVEGAFADGDRVTFESAPKKQRDAGASNWLNSKLKEMVNQPDELRQSEIMTEIIRKGTNMNYVFPQLEAMVQMSPLTPGFGESNDLYESIKNISPAYASRLVSDKQAAWHDAFQISRSLGGLNDEQARDIAMQMTPERMKESRSSLSATADDREERDEALADGLGEQAPWLYKNMVLEYATILRAVHPTMSTEDTLSSALAHFQAGHLEIDDGLWVPRRTFASIPANRVQDVMDAMLVDIPEMLNANGILALEGEYQFVPDDLTEKDGRLILLAPDGLPPGPFRFGAREFLGAYGNLQREKFEEEKRQSKMFGQTQVIP